MGRLFGGDDRELAQARALAFLQSGTSMLGAALNPAGPDYQAGFEGLSSALQNFFQTKRQLRLDQDTRDREARLQDYYTWQRKMEEAREERAVAEFETEQKESAAEREAADALLTKAGELYGEDSTDYAMTESLIRSGNIPSAAAWIEGARERGREEAQRLAQAEAVVPILTQFGLSEEQIRTAAEAGVSTSQLGQWAESLATLRRLTADQGQKPFDMGPVIDDALSILDKMKGERTEMHPDPRQGGALSERTVEFWYDPTSGAEIKNFQEALAAATAASLGLRGIGAPEGKDVPIPGPGGAVPPPAPAAPVMAPAAAPAAPKTISLNPIGTTGMSPPRAQAAQAAQERLASGVVMLNQLPSELKARVLQAGERLPLNQQMHYYMDLVRT
ncbi:MAG: hypothetical protein L0214_06680, partial [candidate division NC10 bacterium]|nr:hypothetical protein [candidate division NC10 bacterium]